MARQKDPMQEEALKLLNEGVLNNREIANKLGIDERKVSSWKSRYITKVNGVQQSNKRCTTKKIVVEKPKMTEKEIDKFLDDSVTEKQRLFCIYYIQSFNATQSAIKAGYSKDSAYVIGHENLRKPKIKEFLAILKADYMADDYLEGKRLLERHKQIAFADMKDYIDSKGRVSGLSDVDGTIIKKVTYKNKNGLYGSEVSTSIELEDRSKSLDFLSKVYTLDPSFERIRNSSILDTLKAKIMINPKYQPTQQELEVLNSNDIEELMKLAYGGGDNG